MKALKEVQSSTSVSTSRSSSPPSSVSTRLKPQKEHGKNPSLYTQCLGYADESFKQEFGQAPSWSGKDFKHLRDRLKKPDLTFKEFQRRWDNFVTCREEFIKKQRLSLAYFCSNFDRFIGDPIRGQGGVNAKSYSEVPKY